MYGYQEAEVNNELVYKDDVTDLIRYKLMIGITYNATEARGEIARRAIKATQDAIANAVENLQPVKQEIKTGEYVHVVGYGDCYRCTGCGTDIIPMRTVKFCPECGTKILKMTTTIKGEEQVAYPWGKEAYEGRDQ